MARRKSFSSPPLSLCALLPLGALAGCAKEAPPAPAAPSASPIVAPSAPSAPPPAASVAAAPASGPAAGCTLEAEKVWATAASSVAGLTQTPLAGGRVAYGVVVAGRPDVLVFDERAEGRMLQVGLKRALTAPLPKDQGRREILRVTPGVGSGGQLLAFVDYRESGVEARRLVACGASDSTTDMVKFEGKPLLSMPEDGASAAAPSSSGEARIDTPPSPPPPASGASAADLRPEPAPAGSVVRRRRPPALKAIIGAAAKAQKKKEKENAALDPANAKPPAAPPASAEGSQAAPPGKPKPKGDKLREIRDCRTLVDGAGAHALSVGSELVGQPYDDGTTEWSMVFFAARELGRGRVDLSVSPLGKAPSRLPLFEVPVALDLGGGSFAISTRYRGSILSWLLDSSRRQTGSVKTYPGGSPRAPRWARVGDDALLSLVQREGTGPSMMRIARLSPGATTFPASLSDVAVAELDPTQAFSTALAGEQRYLVYQAGESARRLLLSPVDPGLAPSGAPLWIDSAVQESFVTAVPDGRVLVVYLRAGAAGRVELVSRVAKCG